MNGNGGRVIVWGNDATRFNGTIQARGGQESGDGGFVEVSGKENLNFTGTVDVSAKRGTAGTLLIDPENITIINGSGGSDNDQVTGDNQVLFDDSPGQRFTIAESTLEGLLAEANVILEATNNITINNLFDNELTFTPGPGGSITFTADADGDQVGAFSMNSTDTIRADARNVTISGASLTIGIIDTATPLVIENINSINHTVNINGAPINLTATRGSIRINGLDGNLNSLVGRSITINTPSILSVAGGLNARSDIAGNAGNVTIGNQLIPSSITVGEISTRNLGSGSGGNINITTTGLLNVTRAFSRNTGLSVGQVSSNNNLSDLASIASEANGSGGNIKITANGGITTAAGIFSDSLMSGDGGTITINSRGNIQVSLIDAQGSQNGTGGNVNITTEGFFQTTGIITDQNQITASISTAGGVEGGSIFIEHGGGVITPFSIGDASINGTIGSLTTGSNNSIVPFQSIVGSFSQGTPPADIQIITQEQPPEPRNLPRPPQEQLLNPLPQDQEIQDITLDTVIDIEDYFTRQFTDDSPQSLEETQSLDAIQNTLRKIEQETGVKPALIYALFDGQGSESNINNLTNHQLKLVLVTAQSKPIYKLVPNAHKDLVLEKAQQLRDSVKFPRGGTFRPKDFELSQQFYKWLVAELEEDLTDKGINNLVFVMDVGLRSLPLAALHDGQEFILQKYSIGLMSSMSLTDTQYANLNKVQVLAMGTPTFPNSPDLSPLPTVEEQLKYLAAPPWSAQVFKSKQFTTENLSLALEQQSFSIVHLGTHAEFNEDKQSQSYIQFFDKRLGLEEIGKLPFNKPPVNLLVLSACKTALGNKETELGFAGFAHKARVKSVLASLWEVPEIGTSRLMKEFYQQLQTVPIKAEALRQAQLALSNDKKLSHPYYWAWFTIVGSPW
ncbi:CHAT domain-containing protein [Coleofasciculus chthonoplastes]|uniref:CHAT domain-containing protein n=1 Tax=Coleofasciculus chthonoplastes TaxID=64178 RepID=UPI0032F1ABC5